MARETVALSRKIKDEKSGKESTVKGTFTIEWPSTPEAYAARFQSDAVRDAFEYQALKQRLKQAAASWLTSNPKNAGGLQAYMDGYTIAARKAAKSHTANSAVLKELDIDTDKLAALAAHLGISVTVEDASAAAGA